MQYSTWQSAGKGLKLHGGFWGPGGTCFAQVLKPSEFRALVERASRTFWNPLNAEFRPGKAGAKGERCTGGFRVLVKRAWRRCGNRLNAIFDLAKRWQRAKAARRFWGPGGTCFAQVLKPSKCSISTWQGKGKGWKVHRFRVLVKFAWRRCGNRLHAIFDLAKRWQRAKAARRVLGPWWNVLRAGFETL